MFPNKTQNSPIFMFLYYIYIQYHTFHHWSENFPQGYGSNSNDIFILTIYPGLVYMLDRVFLFMLSRLKHVWYTTGIFTYVKQGRASDWVCAGKRQWQKCILGFGYLYHWGMAIWTAPSLVCDISSHVCCSILLSWIKQINMLSSKWSTTAKSGVPKLLH